MNERREIKREREREREGERERDGRRDKSEYVREIKKASVK